MSRYLRYLGNVSAAGQADLLSVAVLIRGIDQILPADGSGLDHGSLTYLVRDGGFEAPFIRLPFVSLLIADNLTDVEPLLVNSPKARPIHVPLPAAEDLAAALGVLEQALEETVTLGCHPGITGQNRCIDVAAIVAACAQRTFLQKSVKQGLNRRFLPLPVTCEGDDFVAAELAPRPEDFHETDSAALMDSGLLVGTLHLYEYICNP